MNAGDAAVLRSDNTEFLLVSKRVLAYDQQVFRDMGVEPNDKDYLLLKIMSREDVTPISCLIYKNFPFTRITRPKWPWDENPFEDVAISSVKVCQGKR